MKLEEYDWEVLERNMIKKLEEYDWEVLERNMIKKLEDNMDVKNGDLRRKYNKDLLKRKC